MEEQRESQTRAQRRQAVRAAESERKAPKLSLIGAVRPPRVERRRQLKEAKRVYGAEMAHRIRHDQGILREHSGRIARSTGDPRKRSELLTALIERVDAERTMVEVPEL